ncbi:MAG: hypothetical protein GXO65_01220 [Euryarchaeota archaeon]|nr:hypothetical protein [Euryarchaeota archaeon]
MMKVKVLGVMVILALLSGCGGGQQETAGPPVATTAPATTLPPATTSPPVVTSPPPPAPTPGPGAFFADPSTPSSLVLPPGADKVKDLTDQDYFTLNLPSKTGGYDSGIKGIYVNPVGTIYVLRFKGVQDADYFFKAIEEKLATQDERLTPKTLTLGDSSHEVYHRYKYNEYLGTYIKKGVFIYFLTFNVNEFGVEDFIIQNMPDIFLDIGEVEAGTSTTVSKTVDFQSPSTAPEDVLPDGGSVSSVSSAVYQYDLKFPSSPAYESAAMATYSTPAGSVYVFKYRSELEASDFLQELEGKISRSGDAMTKAKTLQMDGKTLDVLFKQTSAGVYIATIVQKGPFVIYIGVGSNEFEAESFIKQKMPYLFG